MTDYMQAYFYSSEESESSESDNDDCEHLTTSNVDGTTVCLSCGLKIDEALLDNETCYYGAADTRYSSDPSRHNQRRNEERSLYNDLVPLGFPQEIVERANTYYKKIIENKIYRARNRLSIVFACTYYAYSDMQEPREPNTLAQQFKLDKKGISNGFKTFSHIFRKRPDKKYIDAMDLVPKLLSDLNIDGNQQKTCFDDIQKIFDFVQSKSKTFNSSNPRSIAAGLVYYYLKLKGVNISRIDFSHVVKLTDITFIKIATDIHEILDSKQDLKF